MKSTFSSGNRNARWCSFLAKLAILRGGRFRLAAFLAVVIVWVPLGRAQTPASSFSLNEVSRLSVGTSPFGTALVDLNGDGHLDIVASNYGSGTISVLLSGPNGTLGTPTDYAVGSHPILMVSGDFNRDGKPDIAVTMGDSSSVAILLSDGLGGLLAPQYSPVGSSPFGLVVADFNRDGVLDLAVANSGASTVSVLMGTGTGSFAPQVTYPVGSSPLALVAGDLNTDGAPELVVGNFSSNTVSVLLNDGAGHFSPGGNYGTGNGPNALALGDIDNDGRLDLVDTDWYDDALSVLKGNGDGSFAPRRQVYLYYGAWPNGVRIFDLDGDGHLDLVVGDYGGDWDPPAYDGVALLLGDGAGNFGTSTLYKAGYRPQGLGLSIGDINGDGVLDVVVANVGGGVSILAGSGGVIHGPPAQTWIELAPTGTPPHPVFSRKNINYDAANNRLIAFYPGNPPFNGNPPGNGNEVWILTNANGLGGTPAWTKLLPSGSPPFSNGNEIVVYDAATNRLIVYGGCFANCSPALSNVFVLSNANGLGGPPVWSQSTVTNPQARAELSAVDDSANNLLIAFAGHLAFFGTDHNDIRILSNANGTASPSTWTTLGTSGGPPGIRGEHSAIYDQTNNRMTIFAGHNSISTCCPYVISDYNDAWVLSNANGQSGTPIWTQLLPLGSMPGVRGSHSGVYDPANNRMIVFGGSQWNQAAQTSTPLGDLWILTHANGLGGTPEWTQLSQSGAVPGPRLWHTAAFDSVNQRMIILGGIDQNDVTSNRVWVLILNQGLNQNPTAVCQDKTVSAGPNCVADASIDNGSFDPDGDSITVTQSPAGPYPLGTTNVTLTVTDTNGASSTCSATVTVVDNTPPSINCPANITKSTDPNLCSAVVTYTTSTPADDCPGEATVTCSPASGSIFAKGVTTVTCTAIDASGNTSNCSFTVTVNDTEPPSITCPANVTKSTDPNLCSAVVTYATPTPTDNCPGSTATCSPASGGTFPKGVTTVTCSVGDASGNSASCTFTVTVNDTQPPILVCPANIMVPAAAGLCSAVVTYALPAVSDNCTGVGTPVCTPPSGSNLPKGTTVVNCTVKDAVNNSSSCSFTVTVNDTQPPSITCAANITAPAAPGLCSAVVTYSVPPVSDNCTGVGTPVCAPPSGSTFPKGTTVVTCSVKDAVNNSSGCSFTITVNDTQPPAVACPANITTNTVNAGNASVGVNFAVPTAADNCPGVGVICVPPSGSQFARGTTTVTCTATDTSNNRTSCSFTVRVLDYVIVDAASGRILRFDSATGDYDFFDCRKGTSLSGRGQVTVTSCKTELRDIGPDPKHPDRNVSALANPCTRVGNATIIYAGATSVLNDPNLSNNIVSCP